MCVALLPAEVSWSLDLREQVPRTPRGITQLPPRSTMLSPVWAAAGV